MSTDRPPVGICPTCLQWFRLTKDGHIWTHTKYGAASAGYRTPKCSGSGQKPGPGQPLTPEREQEIDRLLSDTDKLLAELAAATPTTI